MFDTETLFWGIIFSSIGMGYFIYGKKQQRIAPLVCGIGLMIFPYFSMPKFWFIITGFILGLLPYLLKNR